MRKKRIFIGFAEVAGLGADLCSAFRKLGHKCDLATWTPDYREYSATPDSRFSRLLHKVHFNWSKAYGENKNSRRIFWKFCAKGLLTAYFLFALLNYDYFIFLYNRTFSKDWFLDIPILHFFGKKILMYYAGSDSRPYFLNGKSLHYLDNGQVGELVRQTALQRRNIKKATKYADYIIDNPPAAIFHHKKYISCFYIGIPRTITVPAAESGRNTGPVKILHAPSHEAKGTEVVRVIIKRLKARHDIEYIELIGRSNQEVLQNLHECDFVIDQMWNDTPMAGLATEAAFYGKPSVVGGYYGRAFEQYIPADIMPPSCYVHPDEVEAAVERLIVDAEYRGRLGRMAKQFVEAHCRPTMVADRILRVFEGAAPDEWFCEPGRPVLVRGWGISEDRLRLMLKAVVEHGGQEALQLADKPDLAKALIDFAQTGADERAELMKPAAPGQVRM